MLKKFQRVSKKLEIERILKKGKRIDESLLSVFIFRNNLSFSRAGVLLSGRTFKGAVLRNRLKRQAFIVIGEILPQIKTNCDILVKIKAEVESNQLKNQLTQCLKKEQLL